MCLNQTFAVRFISDLMMVHVNVIKIRWTVPVLW